MSTRPTVRPSAGADRWFEIKSQVHLKLLNTLSPEQLKALNKEGVRAQIGMLVERLVLDEGIPMTMPGATRSSKRFRTKSLVWVRWSSCSRTTPFPTSW